MAKLRDIPTVFRSMGVKGFIKKLVSEILEDGVFTWASAMAYSWVFALFPLLIAILTLAPYLPGPTKETIRAELQTTVKQSMGGQAGETIIKSLTDVMDQTQGGLLSVGILVAIITASGGMAMTIDALNRAYEVKSERPWWKQRLVATGLTVATIFLVLVVAVLLPIGGAILGHFENQSLVGPAAKLAINLLRYALALGLLFTVVAMTYYFGPNIKQKWQTVSPGATVAVAAIVLVGLGFGYYVTNFGNFNKTYGTLGAAVALLLFCFISSVAVLIGAELNSVIDFAVLGIKPGMRDFTQPCQDAAAATAPAADAKKDYRVKDDPMLKEPRGTLLPAPAAWWKWAAAAVAGAWLVRPSGSPRRN